MANAEAAAIAADINLSRCLVSKSGIGHDVVTNVCTGETFIVPWQAGDWFEMFALIGLFGLLLVAIAGVVWMIRDLVR